MLTAATIVENIILRSEVAYAALNDGYLNLSAYAKAIHDTVETKAMRPVKMGTIVIALSRLKKSLKGKPPLVPRVLIDDVAVQSGLMEIVFDRTKETLGALRFLHQKGNVSSSEVFTLTRGIGEITLIAPEKMEKGIRRAFGNIKPKKVIPALSGITFRFGGKYTEIPNTFFALLRPFALARMNIIEMISTFTEVTFLVRERDMQDAFLILNEIVAKR